MNDQAMAYWFNYKLQDWEQIPVGFSLTASDEWALEHIPQSASAQELYKLSRIIGKSTPDAMVYVLEAYSGIKHSRPMPDKGELK